MILENDDKDIADEFYISEENFINEEFANSDYSCIESVFSAAVNEFNKIISMKISERDHQQRESNVLKEYLLRPESDIDLGIDSRNQNRYLWESIEKVHQNMLKWIHQN